MQMTMDQAMRPGMFNFARRSGGYVMRSEKRPAYGSSGSGGRKPKPPKAGAFYILMTLIISILIWPVGMVMLWRKKVRMQTGTKLLISLLTMCASVFLIVFLLTVRVEDERFTAFQDRANDWLNKASADLAVVGDAAYRQGVETWGVMTEFANNAIEPAANTLADGLDRAVALSQDARVKLEGLWQKDQSTPGEVSVSASPEAKPEPEVGIVLHVPENTPEADSGTALTDGLLRSDGQLLPNQTPAPTPSATAAPAPEDTAAASDAASTATDAPAAEDAGADEALSWMALDQGIVVETPPPKAETADVAEDRLLAAAEVQSLAATDAPTAVPTAVSQVEISPTPVPTPVPELTAEIKPAGEATVYYNETGRLYHMRPTCRQMSGASAHTLAEAIQAGKGNCEDCGTPDASILNEGSIVWVDDYNTFHTTDDCVKFQGGWKLMSLNDVLKGNYIACSACQANIYAVVGPKAEAVLEAAPAPSEAPAAEATSGPRTVTPSVTLKPAGDATVYHSSNGKFYHRFVICKGMTGSNPYKLSEITSRYKRCTTCDAPDTSLIGQACLWMDSNELCHTSDTCKKFKGDYMLVLRDDALAQGLEGCAECGADEYLVPNTLIAETNG